MKTEIFDISYPFIKNCIKSVLNGTSKEFIKTSDFSKMYFFGATLCIDTIDEFGTEEVFLLSLNKQTVSIGLNNQQIVKHRLLPIDILKEMKKLYDKCDINYKEISWLN